MGKEISKNFCKEKRLENSNENKQKNLSKMARAGFDYDTIKQVLEFD